jgi:hypothetical protein
VTVSLRRGVAQSLWPGKTVIDCGTNGFGFAKLMPRILGVRPMPFRPTLLGAVLGALLAAAPAFAQSPIQLRVAGHFTSNSRHTEGIERPFFTGLGQTTGINLAVTFNPMDQVGAASSA